MEAMELKEILSELKSGERIWEAEETVIIIKSMIEHIGSSDGELRDQLIYSWFYHLIIKKNLLDQDLLKELLEVALKDLLLKGIGDKDTDTVFTRSFTTLLIALILSRDNEDDFLSQDVILQVKNKIVDYINLEKDLRGYIPYKGWAHSVAHVADTLDELIKSKKVDEKYFGEILNALWDKVLVSTTVYIHEEEERILVPILEMLERGLEIKEIQSLLQQIPDELHKQKMLVSEEEYWYLYANCKSFLKSFLIEVQKRPKLYPLQKSIEDCLESEWNLMS
ncbi:DUF2785 domain-containing protein [Psychrobacillus sp. FSL K6-4615]|uniref:DUF2785 domain-containing protein n=1 Tax=Psychrobacillus sp. FSL K6-4615 TaxID=2921551 RepID=UPI0030F71E8E